LTVAFAELLVTDREAHDYINLLDRLVEDCDRIFEDQSANQSFNLGSSMSEASASGWRQGKAYYSGSITSNASSIRRKFGLNALLRQNSQDERPSVWRNLSKHRNPATGDTSSISRSTLDWPHSIDDNSLPKRLHQRAMSRDRPPIAGAFDETPQRPPSSHRLEFPLDTIGEPSPTDRALSSRSGKKKRRSSLSDLKGLMAAATLEDEPFQPLQTTKETSGKVNTNPTSPKAAPPPSKIPISPSAAEALRASRQKENLADSSRLGANNPSDQSGGAWTKPPESPSKMSRHSKAFSTSGIPTLRPTKSASAVESANRPGSPTRSNAQRLRLHSPQKLRERLQSEKQLAQEVDSSLKSELSNIGDEMARGNRGRSPTSQADMSNFTASLRELEDRIVVMMRGLHEQQAATQKELDGTLKSTEAKVRALDQLHKEVVAENELLYEKFNGELGKVIKAVRGKGREDKEELVVKLKEQGEETARLRKENVRLKRQVVSLKGMLRGAE
jgi:hypothetical protein